MSETLLKQIEKLKPVADWRKNMTESLQEISVDGLIMEFGVGRGWSLLDIANNIGGEIYGFDSFEGLPEDWIRFKGDEDHLKGSYKFPDLVKFGDHNSRIHLIKGFFDDTLPQFIEDHGDFKISFLHIDSDLYSSAKTILTNLNSHIVKDTIILFDELCCFNPKDKKAYKNWKDHEWKALNEWVKESKRKVIPISRDDTERVTFKVEK